MGERKLYRSRAKPPDLDSVGLVLRRNVVERLAARFDHRLVLVRGGAGFGKTTALAQSVRENRIAPVGLDVWLSCGMADGDPRVLAAGILEGLGMSSLRIRPDPLAGINDAVWSKAPSEVALILDDFETVPEGSAGRALVEQLARTLPDNGHLVISSRQSVTIPTGRLRARGDLVEIDEDELAFDAEEQRLFASARGVEPGDFDLRWPAFAELSVVAGAEHALDFVWEEILAGLPPERRRALAQVSLFDEVDDGLVAEVTDHHHDARTLLDGLPLVTTVEGSAWRLHKLWTDVLQRELAPDRRRQALVDGGNWLLRHGRLAEAARAFVEAPHPAGLTEVTRAAVYKPLSQTLVDEANQIHGALPPEQRAETTGVLLTGLAALGHRELRAIDTLELAAHMARADGEPDLEARAMWLAIQLHGLASGLPAAPHLHQRTCELADAGVELACSMRARHEAYVDLTEGRTDAALERMTEFGGFGAPIADMLVDQLLMDAARPELVGILSGLAEVADQAHGGAPGLNEALAMWMRGDATPSDTLGVAREFLEAVERLRMPHQSMLTLAIVATIALAAGDRAFAAECLERCRAFDSSRYGPFARGYVEISEAALAATAGDEVQAGQILTDLHRRLPVTEWVPRTYLHSLAALHLLVPAARQGILEADLGEPLSALRRSSAALVSIRAGGELEVALDAPWHTPNLLMAGLWPSHLVELIVAAHAAAGTEDEFLDLIDDIPDCELHLERLAEHPHRSVVAHASKLLARLDRDGGDRLEIRTFGSFDLCRNSVPEGDPIWVRRERVRRLLGYLVEHSPVSRQRAAAELWPDMDPSKALVNLRVNLSYLLKVLEPDGRRGHHIKADKYTLELVADEIEVDAWEFDRLIVAAQRAEDRRVPSEALDLLLEAVSLVGGDYLAEWEDEYWGSFERLRRRSQFVQAATRAGELLLAKGEPEEALRVSGRALQVEPLSERAHRIRISSLLGCDDRAGARRAGLDLIEKMTSANMGLEPSTARLLERLGLGSHQKPKRGVLGG